MKNKPKTLLFLRICPHIFIQNSLTIFLLVIGINATAQTKEISLKPFLGIGFYKTQDQVISPLIYQGTSTLVGMEKIKQTDRKLTNLRLFYGGGKLKNDFKNTAKHYTGQIYYALMKPINKHFYVGAASQTLIAVRDYSVAKSFGLESLSGDIFSTLNLALAHQTEEKKKWGKIQTKVEFAVAGVAIARKMYTIVSNPDLIVLESKPRKTVLNSAEIISISKLKKVDFSLNYIKSIGKKQAIGLDVGMGIYRYERLNAAVISQNTTISAGYLFYLKR